jgi:putative membrane protein insertion efficiency factor
VKRLPQRSLLWLISGYQRYISPAFPRRCRYEPTCSAYTAQAVRELGPVRGAIVGGWRLLRCNPFSPGGIDDLADRRLFRGRHDHSHSQAQLPAAGQTGTGMRAAGVKR